MRLVNVNTLKLEEFFEEDVPPYCILSHRWEGEELTYKDYRKGRKTDTAGYRKVMNFCHFAQNCQNVRYSWVWIDTICINKDSSSELSEAINSMFHWYRNAELCVAYLSDFEHMSGSDFRLDLEKSEWFSRGWTLQELIAPRRGVLFCKADWTVLGHTRAHNLADEKWWPWYGSLLNDAVSEITGIDQRYLTAFSPATDRPSIAQRMSWAARRTTTRTEDAAYCLMGIFAVNMPLIHGERHKALIRLQEEIMKKSTDQSIFAWSPRFEDILYGILAPDPAHFARCWNVDLVGRPSEVITKPYTVTNKGVEMGVVLYHAIPNESLSVKRQKNARIQAVMRLNCTRPLKTVHGYQLVEISLESKNQIDKDFSYGDPSLYYRIAGSPQYGSPQSPGTAKYTTGHRYKIYVPLSGEHGRALKSSEQPLSLKMFKIEGASNS